MLFIPPALLLNGILAVALKVAKAGHAGAGGAEGTATGGGWLDIASELATVMFAHQANEDINRWRERLASRFGGVHVHEPENVALERALEKSAVVADILCLMAASPEQAPQSGMLLSLARKLGVAPDEPAGALSAGAQACIRQAQTFCEKRLTALESEFQPRGIDPAVLLQPHTAEEAAELGRRALAAIEVAPPLASAGCGKLPERVASVFEEKWAGYLFGVFKDERTKNDEVYKLFLDIRLDESFNKVHRGLDEVIAQGREIIVKLDKLTPQSPGGFYVLEALGRFVGRDEERAAALKLWLAERQRPLLIHGPPGIGKSTLARALLHTEEAKERFGERRFYIRCDPYATADLLMVGMGGRWFGLDPNPHIALQVAARLREAPVAVVIDNFETPHGKDRGPSEQLLLDLLGIPDLWMIVGVQGDELPGDIEWEPFRPKPLSLPHARELFHKITHKDAHLRDPLLDGLLRDMDGVPHAIELLAHQAVDESLSELAERWKEARTALLVRGEERKDNIDAAYDFSIRSPRMNEAARRLLRTLRWLPAGLAEQHLPSVTETVDGVSPRAAEATLKQRALAYSGEDRRVRMLTPLRFYVQGWARREFAATEETALARSLFVNLGASGKGVGRREAERNCWKPLAPPREITPTCWGRPTASCASTISRSSGRTTPRRGGAMSRPCRSTSSMKSSALPIDPERPLGQRQCAA